MLSFRKFAAQQTRIKSISHCSRIQSLWDLSAWKVLTSLGKKKKDTQTRGTQTTDTNSPRRLNLVPWRLILLSPQCTTCITPPLRVTPRIFRWLLDFGQFVYPVKRSIKIHGLNHLWVQWQAEGPENILLQREKVHQNGNEFRKRDGLLVN